MKLSKIEMEIKARRISDNLLMWAGLKRAKQIATMVKKNLLYETKRRKKLED